MGEGQVREEVMRLRQELPLKSHQEVLFASFQVYSPPHAPGSGRAPGSMFPLCHAKMPACQEATSLLAGITLLAELEHQVSWDLWPDPQPVYISEAPLKAPAELSMADAIDAGSMPLGAFLEPLPKRSLIPFLRCHQE